MSVQKYNFKGYSGTVYNDELFPAPPFMLDGQTFVFKIRPKCDFWRFGIRFSKTDNDEFFKTRYNKQLRYFELAAGNSDSKTWNNPDVLAIQEYFTINPETGSQLKVLSSYNPRSEVRIDLRQNPSRQSALIQISTENNSQTFTEIFIEGFDYFKIAAWADNLDFELDCEMSYSTLVPIDEIYLSYSRKDDPNWAARFARELQGRFSTVSRDRKIRLIFPDSIETGAKSNYKKYAELIPQCRVFIPIVSLSYLASERCQDELRTFVASHDDHQLLVLPVQISDLDKSALGNPLSKYFSFKFYSGHLNNSQALLPNSAESMKMIRDLCDRIIQLLEVQPPPKTDPNPNSYFNSEKRFEYYPHLEPEGRHLSQDQLEFENDIDSFATVISLRSFSPPLAIGLFGNWGSGKSFFMHKLAQQIEKLTASPPRDSPNVENVVQVKFNSWHYSDSNLWASLITEIFDQLKAYANKTNKGGELEKLTEKMHIAHSQKIDADKKAKALEKNINALERERTERRKRLEDISGISLLKVVLENHHVSQDLQQLNNNNIEDILNDKAQITRYLDQLLNTKREFFWGFEFIKGSRGRQIFVLISLFVIFVVTTITFKFFIDKWQYFTYLISFTTSVIVTGFTSFMRFVRPFTRGINDVYRRLKSIKQDLDKRPDKIPDNLRSEIQELAQVRAMIVSLEQEIQDAKEQILDLKSGKKLLQFIEERSRDENYARQLGLISWIRKDFERLDDLLRKQHEASSLTGSFNDEAKINLRIDRIVLYIDDLDRCKSGTVVKVLEAIHLLLAFPIFVVVVGVDPRWLSGALKETFSDLLESASGNGREQNVYPEEMSTHLNAATTSDYLEKIFQITFSLKPVQQSGRERLIEHLFQSELATQTASSNVGPPAKQDESRYSENIQNILLTEEPALRANLNQTISSETILTSERVRLTIKGEELDFIKKTSPLFGRSPRTISRFVNIYRLIKSHKSLVTNGASETEVNKSVIFMLAIVIGQPTIAVKFIETVQTDNSTANIGSVLEANFLENTIPRNIRGEIDDLPIALFKQNTELISRFSFRLYSMK